MPSNQSPAERAMRAKLASHSRWAKEDPRRQMEIARSAQRRKLYEQVDPDGTLDPAERERRADHAFQAYMTRLALRSAEARRKAREQLAAAEAAEAELAQVDDQSA
jgi:hypothetical protein